LIQTGFPSLPWVCDINCPEFDKAENEQIAREWGGWDKLKAYKEWRKKHDETIRSRMGKSSIGASDDSGAGEA
jgi:hypothetical protein